VLVEAQPKASFGEHALQRGLAHFQRIAPQVVAVQFDKVEGVEERAIIMAAVANERLNEAAPLSSQATASPSMMHAWRRVGALKGMRRGPKHAPYCCWYPHLFTGPTVQQPVCKQASYRLWQIGCVPQCDRACEQVSRSWADASL
jgi:hypothetical protein